VAVGGEACCKWLAGSDMADEHARARPLSDEAWTEGLRQDGEAWTEGLRQDGEASTEGLRQDGEASTEGLRQDGEAWTEGLRQDGEAWTEGLRQDGEAWTEGLHTKNLFVRNKKGRMWLVTLAAERPVDLKQLARTLDAGNLTFASPARLRQHLGVEPGSVTALAALNDPAGLVTVVLDAALAASPAVWCHPLTNDRTTRLSGSDLVRFLGATGHPPVMHAL